MVQIIPLIFFSPPKPAVFISGVIARVRLSVNFSQSYQKYCKLFRITANQSKINIFHTLSLLWEEALCFLYLCKAFWAFFLGLCEMEIIHWNYFHYFSLNFSTLSLLDHLFISGLDITVLISFGSSCILNFCCSLICDDEQPSCL